MPVSAELPRLGRPGSRAAELHFDTGDDQPEDLRLIAYYRFLFLRWLGTLGAVLIAIAGRGAGALPVIGNPYNTLLLGRMLQTSSALVLLGIGFLVLAWVFMWPYAAQLRVKAVAMTFAAWTIPLLFTAPLFTQDIYSYLAQGAIVLQGMDPYSAGPVQLLGSDNPLARSVPFIWANSPSPYGPVALSIAASISVMTHDRIVVAVLAHRIVSLIGLAAAGWAMTHLARRCGVPSAMALWLGLLNPLTVLHLVGGIHNESIMLGFLLAGTEVGLRGVDRMSPWLITASGILITCAGLVKVTGFLALGFVGMALARKLSGKAWWAITKAGAVEAGLTVATTAVITWATGIGLGWVTGQGGAASIRSWMSLTTDVGVISGWFGMMLGLGDHTNAILTITRDVGLLIAVAFIVRMLFATYNGNTHPIGGLGVGTFVLVILFPVIHPWYMLWAILPLATWANRAFFRAAVVVYSALLSFFVLPRGLALPPGTILTIYVSAVTTFVILVGFGWWIVRKIGLVS